MFLSISFNLVSAFDHQVVEKYWWWWLLRPRFYFCADWLSSFSLPYVNIGSLALRDIKLMVIRTRAEDSLLLLFSSTTIIFIFVYRMCEVRHLSFHDVLNEALFFIYLLIYLSFTSLQLLSCVSLLVDLLLYTFSWYVDTTFRYWTF